MGAGAHRLMGPMSPWARGPWALGPWALPHGLFIWALGPWALYIIMEVFRLYYSLVWPYYSLVWPYYSLVWPYSFRTAVNQAHHQSGL